MADLDLAALRKAAEEYRADPLPWPHHEKYDRTFDCATVLSLLDRIEEQQGRLERIAELADRFYAVDLVMTNAVYANAAQELVRLSHQERQE